MKICKKCGLEKRGIEFGIRSRGGLKAYCRSCEAAYLRRYRKQNPEKWREYDRRWYKEHSEKQKAYARRWASQNKSKRRSYIRKTAYGLSSREFDVLYQSQRGQCAICLDSIIDGVGDRGRNGLTVDHCHTSGKVRGLLCARCNSGLGHFQDSPERLRNAAIYLEKNH